MTISPDIVSLPGVRESDFQHYSYLHGAGHVNRVIVMGQVLAAGMGEPLPVRIALWAATYTHDLARRHDDTCYSHGRWAAEKRLPDLWENIFKARGLQQAQLDAVEAAVTWHSRMREPGKDHPHYHLIALLKDADALDRCRLGDDDLDPSYLRFETTRGLVGLARGLYDRSHGAEDIAGMWEWTLAHLPV